VSLKLLNSVIRPHAANDAFEVPTSHPALAGHFPGDPIAPGALLLSLIARAIEAEKPVDTSLGTLLNARFHRPLPPEKTCRLNLQRGEKRIAFELRLDEDSEDAIIASGQWSLEAAATTEVPPP
jgi:3-hydroxymyristoyl/3-hydroxydecanoyl-(acyl carrier protein) dehydratase